MPRSPSPANKNFGQGFRPLEVALTLDALSRLDASWAEEAISEMEDWAESGWRICYNSTDLAQNWGLMGFIVIYMDLWWFVDMCCDLVLCDGYPFGWTEQWYRWPI